MSTVSETPRNSLPCGRKREVDDLERALLRLRIEVDEEVAAADQVEARERRVLHQVVGGEYDRLAQLAADPVAAHVTVEKAAQTFLGNVGRDGRRVDALARGPDRVLVEVRREHLQRRRRVEHPRMLGQDHGDRIRLLAGRARRHPDTDLVAGRLVGKERRNLRLERVERVAIAEEVGDADQQVLEQRAGLAGMGADEIEVVRQLVDAVDAHAPGDAAQDGRPLVVAEVATRAARGG